MLALSIKNNSLENKINNIFSLVLEIQNNDHIIFIKSLIYKKTKYHNVKCLSYDIHWCITNEFKKVTDVIINISSIIYALQRYSLTIKDKDIIKKCKSITDKIREIYNIFKEGLREYGCTYPPFKTGSCFKKQEILDCADIILNTWLQK